MKKSILSIVLAVLLSVCTFVFVACDEPHVCEYNTHSGYAVVDGVAKEVKKCSCGETQQITLENAYVATSENAQSVLDGALGSLDGKTVVFASGEYNNALYFGRPNNLAGSNTVYKGLQSETIIEGIDEIKAMTWGSKYYTRSISNVTFVAEDGVALSGINASSGHVVGPCYDYVLDKEVSSGSAYYLTQIFENITFKGINFGGKVNFETSQLKTVVGESVFQKATSINGLNFVDCSFTTGGTASSNGVALRVYSEAENDNEVIKNVNVDGCKFNTCYQGIYSHHVQNITVKNSSFDTTGHNAIAIQSHGSISFVHGNVVIVDNTFANVGDRIIRLNNAGGTAFTITGNVATNSGDDEGQVIKASTLGEGNTYAISNNSWGDGKTVANPELADAE